MYKVLAYPPPPPPPSSPSSPRRSTRKLLVVGGLIAIVVVSAVVLVLLMGSGGNFNPFSNWSGGGGLGSANALEFQVTYYDAGEELQWGQIWSVKDIGTSNMKMRINIGGDIVYIVNGAQKQAWMISGESQWQWREISFEENWAEWGSTLQGYRDKLGSNQIGIRYNVPGGGTMDISGISVNRLIPDSNFLPD